MEARRLEFQWTPKQQAATDAADTHRYTLYGGARGPGKSYWLRWWLLRFVMLCRANGFHNVVAALFCEDYPSLKDRQISKIPAEFPAWLGEVKESKTHGLGFHLADGDGVIVLRNLDDPSKYQSAEFAAIGVDELTKNPVTTFNTLRGSLRWPGIKNTRFVAATNPGGIGHLWVKDYWLNKVYPPELAGRANEFAFVPALPDDNPHLDAAYWDELNSLPPALAQAWRWGNWDIFEGQAFGLFRQGHHTCTPFAIPDHWGRWRGVDWGSVNPFCCLWLAKDPDTGRLYVTRELYQTGLTDRAQARAIKQAGERASYTLADPSMWTKKTHEDKTFSTADEYQAEGVPLTRADNDRMTGKRKLDTLLEDLPDGLPGIRIFDTCPNLIRTLPALPYDRLKVEDVDSDAEDHAYDALRYALTRVNPRPRPLPAPPPPPIDPVLRRAGLVQGGWSRDW